MLVRYALRLGGIKRAPNLVEMSVKYRRWIGCGTNRNIDVGPRWNCGPWRDVLWITPDIGVGERAVLRVGRPSTNIVGQTGSVNCKERTYGVT